MRLAWGAGRRCCAHWKWCSGVSGESVLRPLLERVAQSPEVSHGSRFNTTMISEWGTTSTAWGRVTQALSGAGLTEWARWICVTADALGEWRQFRSVADTGISETGHLAPPAAVPVRHGLHKLLWHPLCATSGCSDGRGHLPESHQPEGC